MKVTIFATLLASASAFVPAADKASSTALSANKFADAPGVTPPVRVLAP